MVKAKRTYRLEKETLDRLADIAEAEGVTATEALERAIRAYGTEPDGSHMDGQTLSEADGKAVDALAAELERLGEQLDRKDRQIEQLGDALADAQATAKGAQALHAATAQTLALESTAQKKSRFRRLLEALRG